MSLLKINNNEPGTDGREKTRPLGPTKTRFNTTIYNKTINTINNTYNYNIDDINYYKGQQTKSKIKKKKKLKIIILLMIILMVLLIILLIQRYCQHHLHKLPLWKHMLSVSTGMEVRGGGHGGGPEDGPTKRTDAVSSRLRARAAAHDQEIRKADVQRNIEINYPPIIEHPGGEDFFGHNDRIQLRDSEQYEEILRTCVTAPPNKTVSDAQSPPRYRSRSGTFESTDKLPQAHSAGRLKRNFLKKNSCNNNTTTTTTSTTTTTTTTTTNVSLPRLQWKFGSSSSANNVSSLRDETSSQHHRENV